MHLASVGPDGSAAPPLPFAEALNRPDLQYRGVQFGGLSLTLAYAPETPPGAGLARRFLLFLGIGLGLTLAVVLTVLQIQGTARRLAREVAARRSAEARLHVLIQELNHRVRNVLTVAQAIVTRSLRPGLPLAEVRETVIGRYQALATVMSLLTQSDWKGASLRELLAAELLPYAGRARAQGPDLFLRARAAQTLTLVLHELVTNSAKYGALSAGAAQGAGQGSGHGSGHVEVAWSVDPPSDDPDPRFRLDWREVGGPPVTAPERRGFGSQILERVAPQDLAARASLAYEPAGLSYRLDAPLHEVVEGECPRSGGAPGSGARAA
jgi:two-component sensor histidine kinase